MPANTTDIEKRLWEAADDLRANSKLKSSEYSMSVLGLIFLRYADHKFEQAEQELSGKATSRRRTIGKADYQARGVLPQNYTAFENSLLVSLLKTLNFDLDSVEGDACACESITSDKSLLKALPDRTILLGYRSYSAHE